MKSFVMFSLTTVLLAYNLGCEPSPEQIEAKKVAKEQALNNERLAKEAKLREMLKGAIEIIPGTCQTLPSGYVRQGIRNKSNINFTMVRLVGNVQVMSGYERDTWPVTLTGLNVGAGTEGDLTGTCMQRPVIGPGRWNGAVLSFVGPEGPVEIDINF